MSYHTQITLWDFAEMTAKLIAYCLDDTLDDNVFTKYHIREAQERLDDFMDSCSQAFSNFYEDEAAQAMERIRVLLGEVKARLESPASRKTVEGLIRQTRREWCLHNEHFAEPDQSAKVGEIYGLTACKNCYDRHLDQLKEDEEFERSYQPPHTLN